MKKFMINISHMIKTFQIQITKLIVKNHKMLNKNSFNQ